MRRLLFPILNKPTRCGFLTVAFGIIIVAILFVFLQWPRYVLLSDVRHSNTIVVEWLVRDESNTYHRYAFQLDASTRTEFVRELTENLGVDYLRGQATVTPMIGIYLVDNNDDFVAYYVIRHARGGGRCSSMELLRKIASQGRPLSEIDAAEIFNDNLRSKWPHPFRFDYTLPVTPLRQLRKKGRVAPGDCSPGARADPDAHDYRIRFLK